MKSEYSYIDTHAHIYEDEFCDDLDEVIHRAKNAGARKILLPPTDIKSAVRALNLARKYPKYCYAMIGIHPEDVTESYESQINAIDNSLTESKLFIAIGEVGLDFYQDRSNADLQQKAFRLQMELAIKHQMPLMIHSRNAHKEIVETLSYNQGHHMTGVFHCFTGTAEEAKELLQFDGFMLGIGGVATFKNSSLPEVLKTVPLSRIVLETDSPYMAPVPMRGKRNEPSFIPYIIDKLSEIYHVPAHKIAEITTQNTLLVFPSIK